jgi:hypothetical protein
MDACKKNDNMAWVEHWLRTGPALSEVRRNALRRYHHQDHIETIDSLLQMGVDMATPRTTSGLVELQRLFQPAR